MILAFNTSTSIVRIPVSLQFCQPWVFVRFFNFSRSSRCVVALFFFSLLIKYAIVWISCLEIYICNLYIIYDHSLILLRHSHAFNFCTKVNFADRVEVDWLICVCTFTISGYLHFSSLGQNA